MITKKQIAAAAVALTQAFPAAAQDFPLPEFERTMQLDMGGSFLASTACIEKVLSDLLPRPAAVTVMPVTLDDPLIKNTVYGSGNLNDSSKQIDVSGIDHGTLFEVHTLKVAVSSDIELRGDDAEPVAMKTSEASASLNAETIDVVAYGEEGDRSLELITLVNQKLRECSPIVASVTYPAFAING